MKHLSNKNFSQVWSRTGSQIWNHVQLPGRAQNCCAILQGLSARCIYSLCKLALTFRTDWGVLSAVACHNLDRSPSCHHHWKEACWDARETLTLVVIRIWTDLHEFELNLRVLPINYKPVKKELQCQKMNLNLMRKENPSASSIVKSIGSIPQVAWSMEIHGFAFYGRKRDSRDSMA